MMLGRILSGVRTRLAAVVSLMTAVSMAVLSLVVAGGVYMTLVGQMQDYLTERLDTAKALVEQDKLAEAVDVSGPVVLQVVDAHGTVLASSSTALGSLPVVRDDDDRDDEDDDDDDWDDDAHAILWPARHLVRVTRRTLLSIPSGEHLAPEVEEVLTSQLGVRSPYLVKTASASLRGERVTIVALASMATAVDAATFALRMLALSSVVVALSAVALTWFLVGRALRPVEQMRASTVSFVEDEPSQRIDVAEQDRDLQKLAATFNDLLQRSEQALVEQRRFVSDASHQLKSPIAAQRVMIETLRDHPDAIDRDTVLDDLARENMRLQSIVSDLLALARYDEGYQPDAVPVDLIDVIFEEVASLEAHADLSVDTAGVMPAVVRGDAYQLGQALRNLLDNAARYARAVVRVGCTEEEGFVRLTVSDDGPGIPPADRARVFERFVRLDDACTTRTSTGLGLSVVKGIVETHGGTVRFEEAPEGGAMAVVELPVVELS